MSLTTLSWVCSQFSSIVVIASSLQKRNFPISGICPPSVIVPSSMITDWSIANVMTMASEAIGQEGTMTTCPLTTNTFNQNNESRRILLYFNKIIHKCDSTHNYNSVLTLSVIHSIPFSTANRNFGSLEMSHTRMVQDSPTTLKIYMRFLTS